MQQAQCRELVFDFAQRIEHLSTVLGRCGVELGLRALHACLASTSVKDGQRHQRTHAPGACRPFEKIAQFG